MSLMPTGDKGQRYEISAVGFVEPGQKMIIGWTEQIQDAERMARGILLKPSVTSATIKDRWGTTPSWGEAQEFILYGGGVLR